MALENLAALRSMRPLSDWIRLDIDLMDLNRLEESLEKTRNRIEAVIALGASKHFAGALLDKDFGAQLVLHEESYQELLASPNGKVQAAAKAARAAVDKIMFLPRLRSLPWDIQEMIVKEVLHHDEPILEFGGIYANPRGTIVGKKGREEHHSHLAITKTCRSFRAFVTYYFKANTFAFLDAAGLAGFCGGLARIGMNSSSLSCWCPQ